MVFTLALAIGATTAIFSVVYGVLLRPLPYAGADRIMAISEVNPHGRPSRLADPNFDDFRDQSHSFQSIAKYSAYPVSVSGAAQPTRTTAAAVTPQFLTVFGVEPIMGRDFTASDDKKGAAPVALVSYGYWRQYLGSTQDLSQSHLKMNNSVYSVIGVLPPGFRFPDDVDVWFAADTDGENPEPHVAQLFRDRPVERWRERRAGARRYQHHRAQDLPDEREVRLSAPRWKRSSTAGFHHRHGALAVCSFCWARWDSYCSWRARTWRTCCWRRRRCGSASLPFAALWAQRAAA